MGTNWGLFLCNCRRTLPLDPERLVLPIAPSVLSFASDPETDIQEFAARASRERLDRVLISCCAGASRFEEAFGAANYTPTKSSSSLGTEDLLSSSARAYTCSVIQVSLILTALLSASVT
jgi:hypothetical protein